MYSRMHNAPLIKLCSITITIKNGVRQEKEDFGCIRCCNAQPIAVVKTVVYFDVLAYAMYVPNGRNSESVNNVEC